MTDHSQDPGSRRTPLSTAGRLERLAAEVEQLPVGPTVAVPAAELLGRCWPAVASIKTVETVLVDEALRDAPTVTAYRHRESSRFEQQEFLDILADALGADVVEQGRGEALLLGDFHETSTDEAHMHLDWWTGDQEASLLAALELKNHLRGRLAAIAADQAASDVVRTAAITCEVVLRLIRAGD